VKEDEEDEKFVERIFSATLDFALTMNLRTEPWDSSMRIPSNLAAPALIESRE